MENPLFFLIIILSLVNLAFIIKLINKNNSPISTENKEVLAKFYTLDKIIQFMDRSIKDEFQRIRDDSSNNSKNTREENANSFKNFAESNSRTMTDIANLQKNQLDSFSNNLNNLIKSIEDRIDKFTTSTDLSFSLLGDRISKSMLEISNLQKNQLDSFSNNLNLLSNSVDDKISKLVKSNEDKMNQLNESILNLSKESREELSKSLKSFENENNSAMKELNEILKLKMDDFKINLNELVITNESRLEKIRENIDDKISKFTLSTDQSFTNLGDRVSKSMSDISNLQKNQLDSFANNLNSLTHSIEEKLEKLTSSNESKMDLIREQVANGSKDSREELVKSLKSFEDQNMKGIKELNDVLKQKMDEFSIRQTQMVENNENKLEKIRNIVETKIQQLQEENSKKLEEMRSTVDEKLQSTLEKRLSESFKVVSDRLESVHKGLGEMQELAKGVGDLKNVLSNVKTKGVLGEYQLDSILDQFLNNEQYNKNVKTKSDSSTTVEFAIKLPSKSESNDFIWLPIDSKFPTEDYQALLGAYEKGDTINIEIKSKALSNRIKSCAKDIRDKYIDPPNTTDFGILFLPFEGLYAEVLRIPGLFESIQREFKITITGPTTIMAFLNSLQMGFRTLAIQKRSSEVWDVLGAVKTEFDQFGVIITQTHKKLKEASNVIEKAGVRTRAIQKKLKEVEQLPIDKTNKILGEPIPDTLDSFDD